MIAELKQKRYLENTFTGMKYRLLTLITGTLIGSSVGFIQEGIDNIGGFGTPFYDYYFKPLYWVTMFGIIPAIAVGLWSGRQIKRKGQRINVALDCQPLTMCIRNLNLINYF